MSNDYAPIPDADLEASFMETLALLRKNSTEGRTALSELQKLAQQLGSNAYLREVEYKNVMAMAESVNAALAEIKKVIENSKPKKKTRIEEIKDVCSILFWGSTSILFVATSMVMVKEVLIYFNIR